ncbi:MAG TPA: TonB-dependent receptor, partial [Byssovorax sp.]
DVTLTLDVGADGKILAVAVAKGAGHGFDEAAVAAGKKLEFDPAHRPDGTPFAARILYQYHFKLEPKAPAADASKPEAPKRGELHGVVLATGGDAPIAGATVTITATPQSRVANTPPSGAVTALTDERGAFTFADLDAGALKVSVRALGYAAFDVDEVVEAGSATEVKYRLTPESKGGLEVTVRGDKPPREVTKRTLERREIERIPGTNGDALRSLQSLPGVARPPALAGLLIVRGSAPQDTATFIDGTPVPIIYHFGGLSSVVPTEMLEKIDFYPGNFSAQYGRAMGGVVDVGLRSPNDDGHYHGLAQADLIDTRAMLEGPIPLLKGWTFIAAGRRSFLDAWFGSVAKAAGIGATQAPVYYDYQFAIVTKPSKTSELKISWFGDDDALALYLPNPTSDEPALGGSAGLHTAFERFQIRFTNDYADGDRVTIVSAIGKDRFNFGLGPVSADLDWTIVTGRLEYAKKVTPGFVLDMGVDVYAGDYSLALTLPTPSKPGSPPSEPFSIEPLQTASLRGPVVSPAAYVEAELTPNERTRIVPGVRVDLSNLMSGVYVSPRLVARYDIFHDYPRTTVKGGIGMYVEPPQPQEAQPPVGTAGLVANRAVQYEVGVEQEFTRQLELSVDGFYKQFDDIVFGAPLAGYANSSTGYAVGGEVLLKYKPDKRFFGWLAYTLSRSVRTDAPGEAEHLFDYDQTHILTVVGSYNLGHGWEFGARFRLASGNLDTPYVCDVFAQACNPFRTNSLYSAASGAYVPIALAAQNSERLPLFHALDLRVDKRWAFKSWQISAYLDLQNAYNHANVEGINYNFNYTQRQYVTGLPILPSVGGRAEF